MSAVVFILVVLLALVVGTCIGAYFYAPLNEAWWAAKRRLGALLLSAHARLVPDYGRHSSVPGPVVAGELVPVPAAQVAAQADAEQRASDPYGWMALPDDGPVYRALTQATVPNLPPAQRWYPYAPPLTEQTIPTARVGTQPWDTASFAAAPDEQPTNEQTLEMYHTPGNGFGVDRCEADVLAAEDGAQMAAGWLA